MAKEMYRTLWVTHLTVDGLVYDGDTPRVSTIETDVVGANLSNQKLIDNIKEDGFYPANIRNVSAHEWKCTMSESRFVANADLVESRFVGGRTKMVTRNVHTYSAICMEYDMETSEMKTVHYSLADDMSKDRALKVLKKQHEIAGKNIICSVTDIVHGEGLYAMTEQRFYDLAEVKELA